MLLSLLKVVFLSCTALFASGKGCESSKLSQPLTVENKVTRKDLVVDTDYVNISSGDLESDYDYFNGFTFSGNYDGNFTASTYSFTYRVTKVGAERSAYLSSYQVSNSKLFIYFEDYRQLDMIIEFDPINKYLVLYEDGFENDSSDLYYCNFRKVTNQSNYNSYMSSLISNIQSNLTVIVTPNKLNNLQFTDLADYFKSYINTYGYAPSMTLNVNDGLIGSISSVTYDTNSLWWHSSSMDVRFYLEDTSQYSKGLWYYYDRFGVFQWSILITFDNSVIYNDVYLYLNDPSVITANTRVVMPKDNINLHGVLNATRPFFENTWQLDINNKYYIFKGSFNNSQGETFTDLYFTVKNASGYYYFDGSDYVAVPNNEGSTNVPSHVFINALYATKFGGTTVQLIYHDVPTLRVVGGLLVAVLADSWSWVPYVENPNEITVNTFDVNGSYTTYLTGINYKDGYVGIFNSMFNDSSVFVTTINTNDPTSSYVTVITPIDVFPIINDGLIGLTGFLSIEILPSISLGLLLFIPFGITLLLFVIRLFKR